MKIALAQMEVIPGKPKENIKKIVKETLDKWVETFKNKITNW